MTSISSISAYSSTPPVSAPAPVRSDTDGDNDNGKAEASERAEKGSFGPATTVTLSPAAQALVQSQKA